MANVQIAETLKTWRGWSSGSVDELAAVGTAFVWALGLEPLPETTASTQVNRRTIRYYISNDLMDPPEGERRLAIYAFRHLLQLLYIKCRQHAGDRLSDIRTDLQGRTGLSLEKLVIEVFPESLPAPVPNNPAEFARPADLQAVLHRWAYLTGRAGRYRGSSTQAARRSTRDFESVATPESNGQRLRVEMDIGDGISLTVPVEHPLVDDEDGRALILRGIRRLLRDYRRGGGPAGREN